MILPGAIRDLSEENRGISLKCDPERAIELRSVLSGYFILQLRIPISIYAKMKLKYIIT